jgi:hypothetical protein
MNILSCFLRRLKTLDMNNDIIHKLEDIAIKMNNQHDRLERLLFDVNLTLIVCNKEKMEQNIVGKTINLNKKHI